MKCLLSCVPILLLGVLRPGLAAGCEARLCPAASGELAVARILLAVGAIPKPEPQSQKEATHYTCSMHPAIESKSAGKCPKCGMKLLRVKVRSEAHVVGPAKRSGMTIPDVELLDQDGRKVHFYRDLIKEKIVAINFIFTTCTTVCPPMGATFARVRKDIANRDAHFISVSVDPVTDTPERLKAWGEKFKAGPGWTLVTGDKQQIDELLRAFSTSTSRPEDHSPTIIIGNDATGQWTRTYGLAKPSQIIQIINQAVSGLLKPEAKESK